MVKNGVQSLFTGLWVNKKPLKLSDFVIVVSNSLQLIISYHLPTQNVYLPIQTIFMLYKVLYINM